MFLYAMLRLYRMLIRAHTCLPLLLNTSIVREGLPSEWYKQAWDRWIVSQIHAGVTNAGAYARDRADGVMAPASVTS